MLKIDDMMLEVLSSDVFMLLEVWSSEYVLEIDAAGSVELRMLEI